MVLNYKKVEEKEGKWRKKEERERREGEKEDWSVNVFPEKKTKPQNEILDTTQLGKKSGGREPQTNRTCENCI